MATLSPSPKLQIIDAAGAPIVGALLYTYKAGTTTAKTTYTDQTETSANTNPVVSDANGYMDVWLSNDSYKFVLTDGVGATVFDPGTIEGTTIYTIDNIESVGTGEGTVQVVQTISALKALPEGNTGDVVQVLGYSSANDGGGGLFWWNSGSTSSNDDGIIITPTSTTGDGRWYRLINTEINPRWYGAVGNGIANDKPAFAAANTFCETGNYTLFCDAGTYLLSTDPSLTTPLKLLPNSILKWSSYNLDLTSGLIVDLSDKTKHFDSSDYPDLPPGYTVIPQWWGALADGSTDDTTAISLAAEAVPKGGKLYIPGTDDSYIVSNASDYVVTLKSYITVIGDGDSSMIKVKNSTNSTYAVFGHDVSSFLEDTRIENIAIDGNQPNNLTSGTAILLNSIDGYIRKCTIFSFATCGINTYSKFFRIENNIIYECTSYITVSQADHLVIADNKLEGHYNTSLCTYGINVSPASNKIVIDTDIINNYLVGVNINAVAVPATPKTITSLNINDNTVDLSRTGLGGYNAPNCILCLEAIGYVSICRNILYTQSTNGGGGIYAGSATTARALQQDISDNIIRLADASVGTLHHGIMVAWSSGSVIKNNNIRCASSSTDYGIKEIGTCTNIVYGNNKIINLDFVNDVASANNLTLGKWPTNTITGTTQINLINSSGWTEGDTVLLEFTGICTLKHNQTASSNFVPIFFKSAADVTTTAKTSICIRYDGTRWNEVYTVVAQGAIKGSDVAVSQNLAIGSEKLFVLTGTGDIYRIESSGRVAGDIIYLIVSENTTTFKNGYSASGTFAGLSLTGDVAVDSVGDLKYVYEFMFDGTYWRMFI